jgi:hypothetical protein
MNFFQQLKDNFFKLLIKLDNGFLCDTCKYNHPNDCGHPERPNSKNCREYRRKT